ncbi:MAG: hypothetical protein QOJ90_1838 [Actinomycetota bacterium]|nr:hypothetical protein [Actinomycetota bacterium]MDQ1642487.1 hypothetical protein [Actinomycetota bacterium]
MRDRLGLARGERVLAFARLADGGWVVATGTELIAEDLRLHWDRIARVEWDGESSTLLIEQVDVPGGPLSWVLDDEPGHLPEVIRERVTDSIVVTRHVRVQGRFGVRVIARRAPGSDELVWQVVVDPGLDPGSGQVQAATSATIAELAAELRH